MTVNIALIGAGRIGAVHATAITTGTPNAALVAVADVDDERAAALAAAHNIAFHTGDPAAALAQPDVDAVLIASPTDTHVPLIVAAAAAGKHIFCEKPVAARLADIDTALAAVADAGVKLQVGFNRRFDPTFARVKAAIDGGEIGTPHRLHIVSRDPAPPPLGYVRASGGLFLDMTIHDFDMARFLYGEVDEVYAVGGVLVDPAIGEAGDIDTAVITLRFTSDAIGTIDNSRRAVYGYDQRVEAFGSAGSASSANLYPDAVTLRNAHRVSRASLPLNFFLERYAASYRNELQAFADAVEHDTPVPVTGHDGRVPVVMALAAARSVAERRPVALREVG